MLNPGSALISLATSASYGCVRLRTSIHLRAATCFAVTAAVALTTTAICSGVDFWTSVDLSATACLVVSTSYYFGQCSLPEAMFTSGQTLASVPPPALLLLQVPLASITSFFVSYQTITILLIRNYYKHAKRVCCMFDSITTGAKVDY